TLRRRATYEIGSKLFTSPRFTDASTARFVTPRSPVERVRGRRCSPGTAACGAGVGWAAGIVPGPPPPATRPPRTFFSATPIFDRVCLGGVCRKADFRKSASVVVRRALGLPPLGLLSMGNPLLTCAAGYCAVPLPGHPSMGASRRRAYSRFLAAGLSR